MAGKKLKTTIKARIMRLGIISVAACSLIMGAFAIVLGTTDLTHSPLVIILVTLLMAAIITAIEIAIATVVARKITDVVLTDSKRLQKVTSIHLFLQAREATKHRCSKNHFQMLFHQSAL